MNNKKKTWEAVKQVIDEIDVRDFDSLPKNTATQVVTLIDFLKDEYNCVQKESVWEQVDVNKCISLISLIFKLIADSCN